MKEVPSEDGDAGKSTTLLVDCDGNGEQPHAPEASDQRVDGEPSVFDVNPARSDASSATDAGKKTER